MQLLQPSTFMYTAILLGKHNCYIRHDSFTQYIRYTQNT